MDDSKQTNNAAVDDKLALALFEQSLKQPLPKREAWLKQQAIGNPDLLQKVMRLMKKDQHQASQLQTGKVPISADESDKRPNRIGPYKVVSVIGRGGMGTVYLGERDTGDFEQQVAIKLIRPGAVSANMIERFTYERQTHARLIHPNIAHLYDGGQYAQSPYIVMEYVDGMPITHWISQHELTPSQRLRLFLKTCRAVNFAHQNLIVHRDITPSNVLVDTNGEVKLIDFGIAKSFVSEQKTESSEEGTTASIPSMSFTPGFAAPEREAGETVTTLADVYSLGKLLKAIFEDIAFPPELNAISQQASALLPEDRYETVNALIQDIMRYQSKYPVQAFSASKGYAVKKFISRHSGTVAVATFSMLAVLIALGVSTYQYQRAEGHLVQSTARFNQVRELARYQLFDLYDDLSKVAGNTQVRANIAKKAQEYLENLNIGDASNDDLRLEIANGYIRLAKIFGVPAQPNLGDVETARASLEKVDDMLLSVDTTQTNSRLWRIAQVENMAAQAMILVHDDSDLEQAFAVTNKAQDLLNAVPVTKRDEFWYLAQNNLYYTMLERADQAGETAVIRVIAKQRLSMLEKWPEQLIKSDIAEFTQGSHHYWMGLADFLEGKHESALQHFEEGNTALVALEKRRANDPMLLYVLAWNNYIAYGSAAQTNDTEESIKWLDRATLFTQRLGALQEGDASIIRLEMQMREAKSQLLATLGKFDEAIAMQEALVEDQKAQATSKPEPSQFETWAFSKIILAYMYEDINKNILACETLEQAEQLLAPHAATGFLSAYMMNAATRLNGYIDACFDGKPLPSQNAMFD